MPTRCSRPQLVCHYLVYIGGLVYLLCCRIAEFSTPTADAYGSTALSLSSPLYQAVLAPNATIGKIVSANIDQTALIRY